MVCFTWFNRFVWFNKLCFLMSAYFGQTQRGARIVMRLPGHAHGGVFPEGVQVNKAYLQATHASISQAACWIHATATQTSLSSRRRADISTQMGTQGTAILQIASDILEMQAFNTTSLFRFMLLYYMVAGGWEHTYLVRIRSGVGRRTVPNTRLVVRLFYQDAMAILFCFVITRLHVFFL